MRRGGVVLGDHALFRDATGIPLGRRLGFSKEAERYTADDSVAVLGHAMGRDLFPWFRSLGIRVDRKGTDVPIE
ncbi:MAG: hypothetical protein JXP34_19305 [Planctomycetes bacterium]|nr:hypothetical protein [Planctomycetota bacterium]